jgi:aspartate aminotransferase
MNGNNGLALEGVPIYPGQGGAKVMKVAVSATLAANEAINARRKQGLPVLPMGFGEAGLPVHESLERALAEGAGKNAYGSVSGSKELCEAVAGYWSRRDLLTDPSLVVCGPGSKPLLFSILMAVGGSVAIASPSWVSYAAQAHILGMHPVLVPTLPGQGGVPDPERMKTEVEKARAAGTVVRAVIVTLPDNPTGTLARPDTIRRLCEVASELDLVIISDEIYRDLVFDEAAEFVSPATLAPERTVITTGLSKNLALGGWRIGAMRLPDSPLGHELLARVEGIASEIWSSPSGPVQHAAAYAFHEPKELLDHIAASRHLHSAVVRDVARRFRNAGAEVAEPQGGFYLYPDLESWRRRLKTEYDITTGSELAHHFLHEYGLGVLAAEEFGEPKRTLRFRVATSLLYGDTNEQRHAALTAKDPLVLPWITEALTRLDTVLREVSGGVTKHAHAEPVIMQNL